MPGVKETAQTDHKSEIEELKATVDIVDVASSLGCLPTGSTGSCYQGDCCPKGHESENGRCFCIWPSTQTFKCFHCGIGGDVISLVGEAKGLDFKASVDWLAESAGLPSPWNGKTSEIITSEKNKRTIFKALTDAAEFFHQALMDDNEMIYFLNSHYGLNEETIKRFRLGYAIGGGLEGWFREMGHEASLYRSTGLFVKTKAGWREFFTHRIVFPYWSNGQVVYFIGRKTTRTPDHGWESAKYKKLLTKQEKHPYISEYIRNAWFYGEDSLRGAKEIFIAEGVTDCLSMIQAGFPTISPATTRIKTQDIPRLQRLTRRAKTTFLVPDSEENGAGLRGALDNAPMLEEIGRDVFIVDLPRPEGIEKIDAADYLRENGAEPFKRLVNKSKSLFQLKVDGRCQIICV